MLLMSCMYTIYICYLRVFTSIGCPQFSNIFYMFLESDSILLDGKLPYLLGIQRTQQCFPSRLHITAVSLNADSQLHRRYYNAQGCA